MCVIDLDDVINESFNLNLIEKLIFTLNKEHEKYFAVSLSSKPFYYDILNFESNEFPNKNIKQLQNNKSINSYKQRREFIYKTQKLMSNKKILNVYLDLMDYVCTIMKITLLQNIMKTMKTRHLSIYYLIAI